MFSLLFITPFFLFFLRLILYSLCSFSVWPGKSLLLSVNKWKAFQMEKMSLPVLLKGCGCVGHALNIWQLTTLPQLAISDCRVSRVAKGERSEPCLVFLGYLHSPQHAHKPAIAVSSWIPRDVLELLKAPHGHLIISFNFFFLFCLTSDQLQLVTPSQAGTMLSCFQQCSGDRAVAVCRVRLDKENQM